MDPKINHLLPLLNEVRMPSTVDKIYKDECIFSYDTPDSPDGLFVCMRTFWGFSKTFVQLFHQQTKNSVFLHLRRVAHPQLPDDNSDEESKKPKVTKLGINIDGGFQTSDTKVEFEEINTIVLLPDFVEIPLSSPNLPEKIVMCVSAVLSADSAARYAELESMKNTWEGEKRMVSKHADSLVQLNNGVKVPPFGWKCEKCDIRTGLYLNLTDGSIHCGRKYFDGTGGNNHAEEHYKETKYPLVVKLGTIDCKDADVYSYDEENMVEDPKLSVHLAHFGLNVSNMKKTEKSILEMEIDLNQRYDEWSIIQEDGCKLKSLFGPGFTGLANLGNSCYLNSVMQVLFAIPDFITEFYRPEKVQQFKESSSTDPTGDLRTQLIKLATGLVSGEYSKPQTVGSSNEQAGIKARMFKNLIGRNHPEFMSRRQQDAQEFFLHVIDAIERLPKSTYSTSNSPPTDCFKFQVEERMECGLSGKVRYSSRSDFLLSLPITDVPVQNKEQYDDFLAAKNAIEASGGKIENDQIVRPIVKMTDCIRFYSQESKVDDFFSPAVNAKTFAKLRTRLKTFPDYLVIHMKKFTLAADWTPKKLDISLEVPDILDINELRATGRLPNEELLPDDDQNSNTVIAEKPFEFNPDFMAQLKDMGFSENGIRRALWNTKNSGVETAMNWILEHITEPDLNAPFSVPNATDSGGSSGLSEAQIYIDPIALENITSMGIEERHARLGLKMNDNNTQQAIEWIFSNISNIDQIERDEEQRLRAASIVASNNAPTQTFRDGSGRYQLVAMISHMGQSTLCGHYVSHIRKTIGPDVTIANVNNEQQSVKQSSGEPPSNVDESVQKVYDQPTWIIFNDNKVAISEKPPLQFAYLYLYKRIAETTEQSAGKTDSSTQQ